MLKKMPSFEDPVWHDTQHHDDQHGRLTYSVSEVAARLGVPAGTVRGWVRRGEIPSITVVGRRLIRVADLLALIGQGGPDAP